MLRYDILFSGPKGGTNYEKTKEGKIESTKKGHKERIKASKEEKEGRMKGSRKVE